MNDLKERLRAWYDAHIAAGWYRASSVLVGWALSFVMFLPNLLDFVANYWGGLSGLAMPKWSPETQAFVLGIYVTFIAPPLRAWAQKKIRQLTLVQAARTGQLASGEGTETIQVLVPGQEPVAVAPGDRKP